MANPFYVEPANPLEGFQTLMSGIQSRSEMETAKAQAAEQAAKRQEAVKLLQSGTPEEIASFTLENPWITDDVDKAIGFKDDLTKQNAIDSARDILINGADPVQTLINRAEMVINAGGDASGTMALAQQAFQDPQAAVSEAEKVLALYDPEGLKQYRALMQTDDTLEGAPAEVQTFEFLTEGMTDEEKAAARKIKLGLQPRATESAELAASKEFAKAVAKLQAQLNLEPQVAAATQAAVNEATAKANASETAKSNEKAWDTYNSAMTNLAKAMAGTETGPFVGFIPAITSNQQIAEGATAVMAPILKQMFKSAGEGSFSDQDQAILMEMVPTRKDSPEARVAKIQNIDTVVRAKLGIKDTETGATTENIQNQSDEELMNLIGG